MNNKYRIVGGVAMVLAAVLATGCQHKRGCVNGSCAAPSYGTQNYGASPVANGAGYGSVNTYADTWLEFGPFLFVLLFCGLKRLLISQKQRNLRKKLVSPVS